MLLLFFISLSYFAVANFVSPVGSLPVGQHRRLSTRPHLETAYCVLSDCAPLVVTY